MFLRDSSVFNSLELRTHRVVRWLAICVAYHPVSANVCPDENETGKHHNWSFTALFKARAIEVAHQ